MSSHRDQNDSTPTARTVEQAIDGLHPNFVNLRFVAKSIEQEIILDQARIRPVEMLLNLACTQMQMNQGRGQSAYPSPSI